ncbi:MAG: lysophospholipid acyltransferase family protein [Candidatus Cloacimonadota bacterium]|nr:lysophospholipid acyltransferase family protein [Candidatus Cloacimonadota bacterium]
MELKKRIIFFIEKYLGAGLLLLLKSTYRIEHVGEYPSKKVIILSWHRNLIPITCALIGRDITVLVSTSDDGEYISGPLNVLKFKTMRGSTSRNSIAALKGLIRTVKKNTIAISPDGPKGPIFQVKDGAAFLSYLTQTPIQPISIEVKDEWLFNSWDKFRFPKPFTKIKITYEDKIYIKSKNEIESKREEIDKSVKQDLYYK